MSCQLRSVTHRRELRTNGQHIAISGWGTIRAEIDWKGVLQGGGSVSVKFSRRFVADFLQAKCNFWWKTAVLGFCAHFGGLWGNVTCSYYKAHWKACSGLPISLLLTELFARCYAWGVTSEYRRKIGDFAPTGSVWPNISGRRVVPTTSSSSQ